MAFSKTIAARQRPPAAVERELDAKLKEVARLLDELENPPEPRPGERGLNHAQALRILQHSRSRRR